MMATVKNNNSVYSKVHLLKSSLKVSISLFGGFILICLLRLCVPASQHVGKSLTNSADADQR